MTMPGDNDFEVIYTNLAKIMHAPLEFLVDFKRLGPEARDVETAPTQVRIVMHPIVAKAFVKALEENIKRYESTFGEIPAPPKGTGALVH
jgi:hypothetical protein